MTPAVWIALAYAIVGVTLVVYALSLRRRLRDAARLRGTSARLGGASR